jgi:hypothetical protein
MWTQVLEKGKYNSSNRLVMFLELEMFTLPEHLSSPSIFSGVRVTRSFVSCICVVDRCLFFCIFPFGDCVVCLSFIYGFWPKDKQWSTKHYTED